MKKISSQFVYSKLFLVTTILMMSLFITNSVAALELNPFGNILINNKEVSADTSPYLAEKFNSEYGTIQLSKTLFWIETDKIAEYSLISKTESIIDLEMYGRATTYDEGTLFDDKIFINQYGENTNLIDGKYYILVDGFKTVQVPDKVDKVCNDVPIVDKNGEFTKTTEKKCSEEVISYKDEEQPAKVWEEYKTGSSIKANNYEWKFIGKREIGQIVDIQPVKDNKAFTKWVWFNSSWSKKQLLNVTENSGANLFNYQVKIVIPNDADMKADYSDLRFVNSSETGEFSYWIENYTASNVTVWVKFDKLTASTINNFYMYYGNAGASTVSNGTSTFIQFGEFKQNGGTLPSCWYAGTGIGYTLDLVNGINMTTSGGDAWDTGHGIFNNCTSSSQYPFRFVVIGAMRHSASHAAYGLIGTKPTESHIDQGSGYFYNIQNSGAGFQITYFTGGSVTGADSYSLANTAYTKYRMELRVNSTTIQNAYVNDAKIGNGVRVLDSQYYLGTGNYFSGAAYSMQEIFTTNFTTGTQPTYALGVEESPAVTNITITNSIPLNTQLLNTSSINFGCNITGAINFTMVALNITNSSYSWYQNTTVASTQNYNATFTNSTLTDGNYTWNCIVNNSGSGLWTFVKDTGKPIINITYPYNNLNITTNTSITNVTLNFTALDNMSGLNTCWYNNGSNDYTVTCGKNYSNNFGEGYNTVTYYVNDSANNLNNLTNTFFINYYKYNLTYSTPVQSEENTTFYFNLTSTNLWAANATLVYNNTNYVLTQDSINTTALNSEVTITLPVTTSSVVKQFYINYWLNGVRYNTTIYNQTVAPIPVLNISSGNCSGITVTTFILQDEENFTSMYGTFDYNIYYGSSNATSVHSYGRLENAYNFSICISNSTNSSSITIGSGEIQYSANNYVNRRYYMFDNYKVNISINNTVNLYDLLSSSQTSFKLEVEDTSLNPYQSVYAVLYRWYPSLNEYKIVDMGKTDETGSTVIHVKAEDTDYRIGVYYTNGTLIYLASPIRMVCLLSPCTYTLKISPGEVDYTSFLNIVYTFNYNETSGIWNFVYIDTTGKTSTMNLSIWKDTGTSSYVICSSNITGAVGSLSCNTSAYSGNLRGEVYRSASPPVQIVQKLINTVTSAFKGSTFGLWLTMLIAIPIIFLLALVSPVAAILGGVISLIPALYFGAINISIVGGFAILGGIVAHFLKRIN